MFRTCRLARLTICLSQGDHSRGKHGKIGKVWEFQSGQGTHTHTYTTVLLLVWNMSGSTRVSRYQKGKTKKVKTNLDSLEQEIVSGSGIRWAICKSAPHADNHANIPPLSGQGKVRENEKSHGKIRGN